MRHKPLGLFRCALMLGAVMLTVISVQGESQPDQGDFPERREIDRTYHLAPGASVDVSMVAGPVEIETANGDIAKVNIKESAQTRADLDCYKTIVEQTGMRLVIRHEQTCSFVRDHQHVKLILPRYVNVSLRSIAGFVRVEGLDGMLRLNSIAGKVTVADVQAAEMSSLAQGISIAIHRVGEAGLHLSSIMGEVELRVSSDLNAEFSASSIIGNVVSDDGNVKISTLGEFNYEARIGSGGNRITVSSVRGDIHLRRIG
jgi:putative adhesin